MGNIGPTQIEENDPERLSGTPEENKRFARNKELFMVFKDDLVFWNTKIAALLESFDTEGENSPFEATFDDDWISKQMRTNTQPIGTICEDLICNYLAEIPLIITFPEFGGVKEAKHRRNEIQLLYKQLENTKDKGGILRVFREIKGKKHGTGGHALYTLQTGETRISLLRSGINNLE